MWRPNRQRHRNYLPGLRDIWKRGEWRIVRLWEQRELQGVNGGVEARAQKWIQRSSIDRPAILRSLKATFHFPHQHTSIFNQNLCQSFCLLLLSPGPRGAVDTSFYLMYDPRPFFLPYLSFSIESKNGEMATRRVPRVRLNLAIHFPGAFQFTVEGASNHEALKIIESWKAI